MSSFLKAGLTGWPVAHSVSPVIHSEFMSHFRIRGTYCLFPVKPGDFSEFVAEAAQKGFTGLNVTVPHKKAAAVLCDSLSPAAESAGAVNTIVFSRGCLKGFNTDIAGFREAVRKRVSGPFYVLGKGGAASAVVAALNGGDVTLLARGEALPVSEVQSAGTVVNATPLGWNDNDVFPFDVPAGWNFVDLNYNSGWKWRNSLKVPVITGEIMLVEQAAEAFRLWTGYSPDEELKTKVLERIREKLL